MAEYHNEKINGLLTLSGDYYNTLDIDGFALMLKDPSYCYKFYWLEAIVKLVSEGVKDATFNEIIDEMISNAWYSVREYHIHLSGIQRGEVLDGLERAVMRLAQLSQLPSNASKTEIKNAIRKHDQELKEFKTQLTYMVPYRALAGFFKRCDDKVNWGNRTWLVNHIEKVNSSVVLLPYTLGSSGGLKKEIHFNSAWTKMIQDNTVPILGWIQYEKLMWLQTNNPEVPGMVYKLSPMDEKVRKLGNVRKLWAGIMDIHPIQDVFTAELLDVNSYDVDHFIPWSFVMNDELWNLMPMDPALNSSKSNNLPKWEPFFDVFADNQYVLYEMIQKKPGIHSLFEKCYKDNLHSIWAGQELYRAGNTKEMFTTILHKNMEPIYDSAKRQGYPIWNYK